MSKSDVEDSSDDENQVEESPCGRWHKRKEVVPHSVVPGIDHAYLAMDMEDGVEVIWNEVICEQNDFNAKEKQMMTNLDSLISIAHPNIVKFHHYWIDRNYGQIAPDHVRVVFITEYTGGSGTLKDFLRRTKSIHPAKVKNWTRWCNQILSSLHYMHTLNTVHGNLTADTIFLQHHGLIKIGCFSIDTIRSYGKEPNNREPNKNNSRYFPDEPNSPAFDIYSFGVIALEMLIPTLMVENVQPKDYKSELTQFREHCDPHDLDKAEFIEKCLSRKNDRPDARALSRHKSLFELSPLLILAAHKVYEYRTISQRAFDNKIKEIEQEDDDKEVCRCIKSGKQVTWTRRNLPMRPADLDKLILDVQNGLYPVNGMDESIINRTNPKIGIEPVPMNGEEMNPVNDEVNHGSEERRAAHIECYITQDPTASGYTITIDVDIAGPLQEKDEKSAQTRRTPECKRHLETKLLPEDSPESIAQELSRYAFISLGDVECMTRVIKDQFNLVNPFGSSHGDSTISR